MREKTRSERKTEALKAEIDHHEPERPGVPWVCPECRAEVPAGVFFCDHRDGDVFSRDMRPRIVR